MKDFSFIKARTLTYSNREDMYYLYTKVDSEHYTPPKYYFIGIDAKHKIVFKESALDSGAYLDESQHIPRSIGKAKKNVLKIIFGNSTAILN